jgi:DNA-binding transcriptional regulator/RsmH inhibitor MraZ
VAEFIQAESGQTRTKVDEKPQSTPVEPPRGFFSAHIDDKGRLKFPVELQQYFAAIGDEKYFVTSVDDRIARIYPISVWKGNEKVLEQLATEDPDAAEALAFVANDYGAETKVDPQGRMTLPTDLRRALSLENQEVRLDCSQGAINIYSKAEYEARKQKAKDMLADKLKAAKLKGFK